MNEEIYLKTNVLEAAKKRIEWLFDEFPTVVLPYSGGKDSTVILHLSIEVARKKNRLPVNVLFIDQEAEWKGTIDMVEKVMNMPEVKPYWYQIPMVITNNASSFERYSRCWDLKDQDKWIHPQNPLSIKVNRYGTERFHELFHAIMKTDFKGKACTISGVRCEEAPKRKMGLTQALTYKHVTWGSKLSGKDQYTFYPLYDWGFRDVWKFINDNDIPYNKVYDEMYRHGCNISQMRISNVHHETAIQTLLLIQEIEPETWNKISRKIAGANTVKHLNDNSFRCPEELPSMFADWKEYAEHLAKHIIQDDAHRTALNKKINAKSPKYSAEFYKRNHKVYQKYWQSIINTILSSDWDFTKFENFTMSPQTIAFRMYHLGRTDKWRDEAQQYHYLNPDEVEIVKQYLFHGKQPEKSN